VAGPAGHLTAPRTPSSCNVLSEVKRRDMSQQQITRGNGGPVPEVVGRYATYLRAKTNIAPQSSVNGEQAELHINVGPAAMVLTFGLRKNAWSLRSAEVRCGQRATMFARGELVKAVAELLTCRPPAPTRSSTAPLRRQTSRPPC
jgi:hypothetical protein